ncbi:MAG: ankyrin repeat domain-containing protein [Akkermansia sp.]|nr:ankyrin repeat domain-containing protein [Akkermansia sp.]
MKNKYIALATLAAASLTSCHTTLYNAAREGDVKTVREELADGADINKGASKANLIWQVPATVVAVPIDAVQIAGIPVAVTPIIYIMLFGENGSYQGGIKFLTKAVTQFGDKTPMQAATNPDVITELLLAGAQGTDWDKSKAVTEAARKGDAVTLRKLMEKSCRGRGENYCEGDYRPLMLAIGGGHEECARILLEHGAKFTSTATVNKTTVDCYDYAVAKGQLNLYKKLGGTIFCSPSSIKGKKIVFDYDSAFMSIAEEDINGNIYWGKWQKYREIDDYITLRSTVIFDKNNISNYKGKYGDDFIICTYKKNGSKTAMLDIEAYEYGDKFNLTFDSETTGTACSIEDYELSGSLGDYISPPHRVINIRFKIK